VTSYAEQVQHNPALKAFVEAEVARACVRLASLEAEHQRDLIALAELKRQVKELKAELRGKRQAKMTQGSIETEAKVTDNSGARPVCNHGTAPLTPSLSKE
jgi:hypothetical protein